MINDPAPTSVAISESIADPRSPSWGAIFAGLAAGLAVHFLLMLAGTALGLGIAQPSTDDNPVASFGIGTAVVWSLSALLSLWAAGWVAGRCAARVHGVSGCMHGFIVWCVSTIVTVLLVISGGSAAIGGAAKIAGQGISAMGQPLAGAAEMAKDAAQQNSSTLSSFVDEVSQNTRLQNAPGGTVAAKREIGAAVRRFFAEGADPQDPQARQHLVQALSVSGAMTEQEANQTVTRWTQSMERMRADLERAKETAATKAREVADKSAKAVAKAALWTFIGFVLGAFAASWGGRSGARWERRHALERTD
jgi:hypothetical protein